MPVLILRDFCNDEFDDCSSWDRWGRWIAFAVIVGCAFLLFFGFACINARRRRYSGLRPYHGTAWMAPPPGPPPPNQPIYQNEAYYHQAPPPQYTASPQSYGYFGAQNAPVQRDANGIELQQPQHAYTHAAGYAPPEGPPPNKS
ncbi:hypothetical protein N7495_001532 [Penicillium taxi]|uniref:uncharacterized protein n=1 Tax=Penicillium taxi TaxID=168475 RepID=UPI0025458329|nr:uncharacterized protein N7495_001532 [Penicillium taxi]KAJ5908850.1 hypothetical protein N7495_001532 [Penicillium taxi]